MHLLGRAGGHRYQDQLWEWFRRGILEVDVTPAMSWQRMRVLMAKYASAKMDMADASLVLAAERTGLRRIFTFDSDFGIYLINDQDPFAIVP
jgi:predicted nucleic acid-binding protein